MTSRRERGFVTIQYASATALSLVLLVMVANLLVDLYARAAVRDALDEGVRAGAVADRDVRACEAKAKDVLDGLLRGATGRNVDVVCAPDGAAMTARATGTLHSWLPIVPDWHFTFDASMDAS
ncbi:MAG: hypothetical protein ACT4OX_05435 [Actinomycetota bacterium]